MTRRSTPPATQLAERLVERFDASSFDAPPQRSRIALVAGTERRVLELGDGTACLTTNDETRVDATLSATGATWKAILADVRGGMDAFAGGRLVIRGNLHLAIGLLAATSGSTAPERLRVLAVRSSMGTLSTLQAGAGEPVVMLHGLGATKASFLPSIAALAPARRVIAVDLPGFGDSVKPLGAAYDARFFARSVVALLDSLELPCAHVVGHSMGGRAALEMGLRHPERVASLALMTPSLPWLRSRPWAPLLRLVRPELGLIQPAPRAIVDRVVQHMLPGSDSGWMATAVDEFLRAFGSPRGRAAFYAAARSIYLEDPARSDGLWRSIATMQPPALFVWGRRDGLVPVGFARHVERLLPRAEHLHLDCGHVPQIECPRQLHTALAKHIDAHPLSGTRRGRQRPAVARAS